MLLHRYCERNWSVAWFCSYGTEINRSSGFLKDRHRPIRKLFLQILKPIPNDGKTAENCGQSGRNHATMAKIVEKTAKIAGKMAKIMVNGQNSDQKWNRWREM